MFQVYRQFSSLLVSLKLTYSVLLPLPLHYIELIATLLSLVWWRFYVKMSYKYFYEIISQSITEFYTHVIKQRRICHTYLTRKSHNMQIHLFIIHSDNVLLSFHGTRTPLNMIESKKSFKDFLKHLATSSFLIYSACLWSTHLVIYIWQYAWEHCYNQADIYVSRHQHTHEYTPTCTCTNLNQIHPHWHTRTLTHTHICTQSPSPPNTHMHKV